MKPQISFDQKPRSYWFLALLSYYVLAMYLVPPSAIVLQFSPTYFALIIPAWLYVIANWRYLVMGYSNASKALALFAIMASVVGLLRWDISLVYNSIFLSAVGIVILNSKAYVTISELNWLFFCTVIGSVVVYNLGITDYGFLPGQANAPSCHAAMNWRISLFRVPAESAMFSFVILAANILYGNRVSSWLRGATILLATYFLLLSGVRSIVFPALVVCFICMLMAVSNLTTTMRRRIYVGVALVFVVVLSVSYHLGSGGDFWKNYWLRTKTCDYQFKYDQQTQQSQQTTLYVYSKPDETPLEWYAWTFNRHYAALYQLSLFAKFPLGSQSVQPVSEEELTAFGRPSDQLRLYCSGCNFVTHWLARAGIAAVPLVMCFFILMAEGCIRRSAGVCLILSVFGLAMLTWGVMFVPYNFIFLLMLAVPSIGDVHEQNIST